MSAVPSGIGLLDIDEDEDYLQTLYDALGTEYGPGVAAAFEGALAQDEGQQTQIDQNIADAIGLVDGVDIGDPNSLNFDPTNINSILAQFLPEYAGLQGQISEFGQGQTISDELANQLIGIAENDIATSLENSLMSLENDRATRNLDLGSFSIDDLLTKIGGAAEIAGANADIKTAQAELNAKRTQDALGLSSELFGQGFGTAGQLATAGDTLGLEADKANLEAETTYDVEQGNIDAALEGITANIAAGKQLTDGIDFGSIADTLIAGDLSEETYDKLAEIAEELGDTPTFLEDPFGYIFNLFGLA